MKNSVKQKNCIDSCIDAIVEPFGVITNQINKAINQDENNANDDFFESLGNFLSSLFCCNQQKSRNDSLLNSPIINSKKSSRQKVGATPPSIEKSIDTSSQNPVSSAPEASNTKPRKIPIVLRVTPVKSNLPSPSPAHSSEHRATSPIEGKTLWV